LVVRRWSLAKSVLRTTNDQGRTTEFGAVAQLGERLVCNQEATGSIPVSSTRNLSCVIRYLSFAKCGFVNDQGRTTKDQRESMQAILNLGGLLVPIIALIVGGAIAVTAMVLKHQERIAKIERGIDPDAPWPQK
jgi:hypothetical protein